jgi:glycosyltransferase involved in cell wall biosynthesis
VARKVVFFSDAPYEGGAERYVEYLIGAIPRAWLASILVPARNELDAWAARLSRLGARVRRAPVSVTGSFRLLWQTVRQEAPDVVHLNLPYGYSACYGSAAPVARLAGARVVVATEHLTMIEPMRLRGRVRRLMATALDRIITLSESNRRDLTVRHGIADGRIRVVMNGVPAPPPVSPETAAETRRGLGARKDDVLLVHVGALTERKGHRFLLDAVRELRRSGWHLAFVGSGEDEAALRDTVASQGLGALITFAGHREDVGAVLAAADCVVLPSRMEGMPLVLLEALALGRPAIATRVYGVPEIYRGSDAAILVSYGDRPGLAAAVEEIVRRPDVRARMGREARRLYLDRFTAARMAADTVAVYEEVLA